MWNWSGDGYTEMHKENLSAVQVPVPGLGLSIEEAVDVEVRCMLCVYVCACVLTHSYTHQGTSNLRSLLSE